MRCPRCISDTLHSRSTGRGDQITLCSSCQGVWLERGQLYDFAEHPQALETQLGEGLRDRKLSQHQCPRCSCAMSQGRLSERNLVLDECPQCGGLFLDAGELEQAGQAGPSDLDLEALKVPEVEPDPHLRAAAEDRHRSLAIGALSLPNLFFKSAITLGLLYSLVVIVLIAVTELGYIGPGLALLIGVVFAGLQFALGPWLHDLTLGWLYDFRWVDRSELPEHLRRFVERVCEQKRIAFPRFGLIRDGTPTAFTYGHTPRNARVVVSQGIYNLLEPEEVEAVVGHELGHVCHWDMAMMTLANLVPLLLYFLYRVAINLGGSGKKDNDKGGGYALAVAAGAYVLYIVSEYIVLWFSRTREFYADQFAGEVTGNPNALSRALVKIAYGLAARDSEKHAAEEKAGDKKKEKGRVDRMGALRVLNIFDDRAATALVMASNPRTGEAKPQLAVEDVKSAMQWDLWNPWAVYYELNSTHPLVAKRLLRLGDQAAALSQEPLVVFDRRKPESYWDDFLVDVLMMWLPLLGFLTGVAGFVVQGFVLGVWSTLGFAAGVALAGIGILLKLRFSYPRDFFPHLSVASLLHKVKVSGIRPVPATLTGNIIGKGVAGLVWSEDFTLQDRTGIIFLDYRQPLAIWSFFFGLFRAAKYQGKEVRIKGWYRRAPMPFIELYHLDVLDGSQPSRHCYSFAAQRIFAWIFTLAGLAWVALAVAMKF